MLNGKTADEKAAIASRMTNLELFELAFASLAEYGAASSPERMSALRGDYFVLRKELEKRLTRTGFLPPQG
jgi:hypothetical protein